MYGADGECKLIFCLEDWGLFGFGLFFAIVVGIPFLLWGFSKLDNGNGPTFGMCCPDCGSTYLIEIPFSAPIDQVGPQHAGQPACGERMVGLQIECGNCGYWF